MKNKRKRHLIVVAIILLLALSMSMVACDLTGHQGSDNNSTNYQEVEIAAFDYGFCQKGDDSSINLDNTQYLVSFNVGETYYMVIEFSLVAVESSNETNSISFVIEVENVEDVQAYIEDANSGNKSEIPVRGETNKSKEATVTFSVPRKEGESADKRIIIKLIPKKIGNTTIKGTFEGDNVNLIGATDGFTIVVDGIITDYKIMADNRGVGAIISYSLADIGITRGKVQVVAFSEIAYYTQSNYSNAVTANF